MFNDFDNDGWMKGSEVVLYNGEKWLVTSAGNKGMEIENDFSNDPTNREYSGATMMYVNVEYVPDYKFDQVQPFATILMKSGKDEEWNNVYRSVGLMD